MAKYLNLGGLAYFKQQQDAQYANVQRAVKLTIAQYEALSSYDDNTVYYVTDNAGTKVITRYIGDTPIPVLQGSVMGESAYGNTVLL